MAKEKLYDLLKIGLTEGEARVYIALMGIGSTTVGPIVKKSGVAYSNIYDVLQRLMEKGIVSYIVKDKTKHFQAASPSNLYTYLEKKEKELATQREELKEILPQLAKLQQIVPQQEAEVFLGMKGLRTAYEKVLSGLGKDDEDMFFYIHEEEYAEESDRFYFTMQSVFKAVPHSRGISNQEYRSSPFIKQASYINMRYVDFPIPGNMDICNDRLLLVSWEEPIIAVLIHSKSIAGHFRRYFNAVWQVAKE